MLLDLKSFFGNYKGKIFFFIIVFIISLVFTKYYFLYTHEYYEPASSERMADFTADKVFQKRVLPTLLAKFIIFNTGLSLDHTLKIICVITCIAMLYGFKFLMIETNSNFSHGLEFFIFFPVAWNYIVLNGIYHSYDLPSLAFFCWGIVFFLRRRFIWFYLLYVVASLNRESTCFITIAIFALTLNLASKSFSTFRLRDLLKHNHILIFHCLVQIILWFIMKKSLEYVFRDNPGTYYEETYSMINFLSNALANQASWPYLDPSTFIGNPRCFFTLFLGIWLLVPLFWQYIPSQTKKLLWIIPPYLFAAILYANLMETRAYHELNIVLTACAVTGLHGWLKNVSPKKDEPL